MQTALEMLIVASLLSIVAAQIWLILIIMRGSPLAAILCVVVPFLVLFFIRDHWESARKPVFMWAGGFLGLIAGSVLRSAQ